MNGGGKKMKPIEPDKTYTMGLKGNTLLRLRKHKIHPRATDNATLIDVLDLAERKCKAKEAPKPSVHSDAEVTESWPDKEPEPVQTKDTSA